MIKRAQASVKAGYRIAVDIDLAKFLDTLNPDVLMGLLRRTIADKRLLALNGRYLRAGALVGEHIEPSASGTPQGGPLSALPANIVLHPLDQELERTGQRFARHADDLIVLVKSKVAPMGECSFLGFTIKGKKTRWTEKAVADFMHRAKELTRRSCGVSMEHRLHKLGQYLRGWFGYFGIGEYYRPVPELDDWLRRCIRVCYWKQ